MIWPFFHGLRLLYRSLPPRRRLVVRCIWMTWANATWVSALSTYYQIERTRTAELIFVAGALASTLWLGAYGLRIAGVIERRMTGAAGTRHKTMGKWITLPRRRRVTRS